MPSMGGCAPIRKIILDNNKMSMIYQNHSEIFENIRTNRTPDLTTKKHMQIIITGLPKDDQLNLFMTHLYPLDNRVCTITNVQTMFGIQDLPIDVFWNLYLDEINVDENRKRTQFIDNLKQTQPIETQVPN